MLSLMLRLMLGLMLGLSPDMACSAAVELLLAGPWFSKVQSTADGFAVCCVIAHFA